MSLNTLAEAINANAKAKGFWESDRNFGEMLMLATSELAEALEEHRDGKPYVYYIATTGPAPLGIPRAHRGSVEGILSRLNDNLYLQDEPAYQPDAGEWRVLVECGIAKPEGAAVELVDCIIRCLDTLHSMGVDIDDIVEQKMAYNATRPPKHGKAY